MTDKKDCMALNLSEQLILHKNSVVKKTSLLEAVCAQGIITSLTEHGDSLTFYNFKDKSILASITNKDGFGFEIIEPHEHEAFILGFHFGKEKSTISAKCQYVAACLEVGLKDTEDDKNTVIREAIQYLKEIQ